MTKADETHSFGLCQSRQVGNGDVDQSKNDIDVVQFQRIDDEMESVGRFGRLLFQCAVCCELVGFCHDMSPGGGALCGWS
ncbi:hypothetical protein OKW41_000247 [Paraburkholderia sp. UCT70]|uniref:hypothetical protein n=1 Tax=Paraburkholderia sp. UCT70 TaxID=2991068 RepID=UPI003D21122D